MEEYICISCWKDFKVSMEQVEQRGGRIVCPYCGYIQTVSPTVIDSSEPLGPAGEMEKNGSIDTSSSQAEEIPINQIVPDSNASEWEEEQTDEIPPEVLAEIERTSEELGFDEGLADEKTPVEPMHDLEESTQEQPPEQFQWRLRTSSGLVFKFTDPETLLSWKKRLTTYKKLTLSPDGERWADFRFFVQKYEESGDAWQAFLLAYSQEEEKEEEEQIEQPSAKPEPVTSARQAAGQNNFSNGQIRLQDTRGQTKQQAVHGSGTTANFSFKTKQKSQANWGKYLLLVVLSLILAAGLILGALYFSGNLDTVSLPW